MPPLFFSFRTHPPKVLSEQASSNDRRGTKVHVHFPLGRQTEGAAVGELHDVEGEALVSGLVSEPELHLRAADGRPLLKGARDEVGREARPGGDTLLL